MTAATIPVHIGWSSNSKTGRMPVSTTGSKSCPTNCKQKDICYAKYSWLGIHWRKVDSGDRDMGWDNVLQFVRDLPSDQIYRWNQAGDLPGVGNNINSKLLNKLVAANTGKRGFTYTHKPLTPKNLELIKRANESGFTINVSCDSLGDALMLRIKEPILPLVVTVAADYKSIADSVKVCPAQIRDDITCLKCQWCAMPKRKFVVAFLAHGCKKGEWDA